MLYLRGQQNNRLGFAVRPKKQSFHSYLDQASDSSFENANQQAEGKRDHSVTSTIDSRFQSHLDSFSSDSEYCKQVEQEEPCEEFHSKGFCLKGSNCCFSHGLKSLREIKSKRKNIFFTLMVQNFPQMIEASFVQRMPSFLQ